MITLSYPQILDLTNLMRDRNLPAVVVREDHVEVSGVTLHWDDRMKRWRYDSQSAPELLPGYRHT